VAVQQVVDKYGANNESTFAPIIVRSESPASNKSTVILKSPHAIWNSFTVIRFLQDGFLLILLIF
jgi:hypothetical protein